MEQKDVETAGDAYRVRIVVRNRGHSSAAQVHGDTDVETSQVTIDFVPEASEREVYLQFTRDPKGFTLDVRALGASQP